MRKRTKPGQKGTAVAALALSPVTRRRRLFGLLACGHQPERQPQGGFRCSRCGKAGADLEAFGFADEAYVSEKERQRLVATPPATDNRPQR